MKTSQMIANLLTLRNNQVTVSKCKDQPSFNDVTIKADLDASFVKQAINDVLPADTKYHLTILH